MCSLYLAALPALCCLAHPVNDQVSRVPSCRRQEETSQLRLALEVGYLAHLGQLRKSGASYITHPVQVACILAGARLDVDTLVAGLLHDTVEDTSLTFEDLECLFGYSVRRIVEGETKVSKLPKLVRSELESTTESAEQCKQDEQAENLRSMFVAMAEDWRVVVVKLADRLHNMRTLECALQPPLVWRMLRPHLYPLPCPLVHPAAPARATGTCRCTSASRSPPRRSRSSRRSPIASACGPSAPSSQV